MVSFLFYPVACIISQTTNALQFQKVGFNIYFMFNKKNFLVVGIATFNVELLRISVPSVARMGRNVFLIIYNDNASVRLRTRDIRRMGYRGKMQIINGDGIGKLRARMAIVHAARKLRGKPQWMIFSDDDAMLISAAHVNVSDDVFAVMQNAACINGNLADLFRAMDDACDFIKSADNIILQRPNTGIGGTMIRIDPMGRMCDAIAPHMDMVRKLDEEFGDVAPVDMIMWSW